MFAKGSLCTSRDSRGARAPACLPALFLRLPLPPSSSIIRFYRYFTAWTLRREDFYQAVRIKLAAHSVRFQIKCNVDKEGDPELLDAGKRHISLLYCSAYIVCSFKNQINPVYFKSSILFKTRQAELQSC